MAIDVIYTAQHSYNAGVINTTVDLLNPSSELTSAISAYGDPTVNVGGSVAVSLVYKDQFKSMLGDSPFTKVTQSESVGLSAAYSAASRWESYFRSQVVSGVSALASKATAYDATTSQFSSIVS